MIRLVLEMCGVVAAVTLTIGQVAVVGALVVALFDDVWR